MKMNLKNLKIKNYDLVQTCNTCPEEYNVFLSGTQVGYLKVRHGHFRVDVPSRGGRTLYTALVDGDGMFTETERPIQLDAAISAIDQYMSFPF